MDVSTIIVSYNTFDLTVDAVRTALESSPDLEQEVIVVDNNSPDGSGPRLQQKYDSDDSSAVSVVVLGENVGFAAANNIGASRASGRVLFFLNPDTLVHPGAVGELFDFVTTTENAGAVGPHVVNEDGTDQVSVAAATSVWTLLGYFLPTHAIFSSGLQRPGNSPKETCIVDVVKGCAIAMRREVYDRVGGWDVAYFLYAEERELCYALNELGYRNYFYKPAKITHFGGASTSRESFADQQIVQQRSSLAFLKRHHSGSLVVLNRILGIAGFGIRSGLFSILGLFTDRWNIRERGAAARTLFSWFLLDYSASIKINES